MKKTLLENERIRLRALEPEDLERLYRWENDASLWEWGSTLSPFSRYVLKEYIAESHRDLYELRQLRLMIDRTSEAGGTVGMVDLFDFEPHHRRAGIGLLVDPSAQRQGYGMAALRLLEEYAFDFLQLHQLYAHVPQRNTGSLRLFERSGFVHTGTLSEWIATSAGFMDVWVFQRLRKDWDQLR